MGFLFLSLFPSSTSLSFFSFSLFFLLPLLSLFAPVKSTVQPSNYTADLTQNRFTLEGTQVDRALNIAPLTRSLVSLGHNQLRFFNQSGTLVQVGPSNSLSLPAGDIAFISCDSTAYTGNLDADATVKNVFDSNKVSAVLLYSTTSSHCNYTNDHNVDDYLFTLLNAGTARDIEEQLQRNAANTTGSSFIVPDMASFAPTGQIGESGGGGGTDSPNTAMIILYSITGIITALFLSIIITGAIRAHRHPERYGPRQRPGRPRQSRARGIARAMLETIPIVKFGDNNDGTSKVDVDKGDVEMSLESEVPNSNSGLRVDQDQGQPRQPTATGPENETPRDADAATPAAESNTNKERGDAMKETETPTEQPNFSCPICTDDFVKGQDLRVLPCNHQFHPECIDPWLVNVSGTCPLCRIDLNPPQPETETENQDPTAEGQDEPANTTTTTTTNNNNNTNTTQRPEETPAHRHRRISNYLSSTLNARRMRDASVEERLAALRSVREEARAENEGDSDDRRRRNRLTARFREKFRIRTRAHGGAEDTTAPASSST
ncbi:RING-H2 finger protein [Aspergillus undulatus]|uniref:RING-H2 finger protein n=1 Tax=Aspergillus undulatus TaxID=1810928 RepID=UPI003CCD2FA5